MRQDIVIKKNKAISGNRKMVISGASKPSPKNRKRTILRLIEKRGKRNIKRQLLKKHHAAIKRRLAWINYYYKLLDENARAPKTTVCNKFGIDYKTLNLWLKRYEENNKNQLSLIDLPTRPKNIKFKVPFWAEILIVLVRIIRGIGAEALAAEFKRRRIFDISHQGVYNIFVRYGLNRIQR